MHFFSCLLAPFYFVPYLLIFRCSMLTQSDWFSWSHFLLTFHSCVKCIYYQ
uniref:Uncharacterized protein n=1 Tax=Rhizophora mucronata TaxID=61149 RepID=A0A2P2QH72_RHIMU